MYDPDAPDVDPTQPSDLAPERVGNYVPEHVPDPTSEVAVPRASDASPYAPESVPAVPVTAAGPTWSEASASASATPPYQSTTAPPLPPAASTPPPIPPAASTANPPPADPPNGRRRSPILAVLVAVALAASGYAVARATGDKTTVIRTASANSTSATVAPVKSSGTSEPIAAVASALAPSVVQIETNAGLGSGFIYDDAGHILTAAHVVTGAGNTVTVRLADGTSRTGTVVGLDQSTDVAVVKVNLAGTNAKPANLATGESLQVGQTAIAIGSPFGLDQTVTSGIVSAVDRAMQTTNGAIDMVQTDAPINPGNSGGPLADLQGRVIGINDQIESESGSSSGVGFAIPIDTAKAVADKLVAGETVTFAYLGVQTEASGQGVVGNGALIVGVESGSPADKAGVQQGDVVTKIGNTAIDDPTTLSASIREASPGDVVKLTVERNGSTKELSVTLGSTSAT